ncbi:ATP-binding protein [Streptomyces sp. NPDC048568]|uniref:ATP-binding protein n=1 Tax=Streptomyces sp. NPDC048568 TaxID=3365571 RepID=UPI00371C86D4
MSYPLMKQAEGQGPDDSLRRHLTWSDATLAAARARAEVDALLLALHHTHRVAVPPAAADDIRLVASELVTNATRHAPGPGSLELRRAHHGRTLLITVRDTSPVMPQPQPADPRRIGGHGLRIVSALSSALIVKRAAGGKQITAELPLQASRPPAHGRRSYAERTPDAPSRATPG